MKTQKTFAEWGEIISACETSGLTVKQWCLENHCTTYNYYYWRKKIASHVDSEQAQSCFAEVSLPLIQNEVNDVPFHIKFKSFQIEITHAASIQEISALLNALPLL